MDVWVLPGNDVVSEQGGQQVDLEEVFVQILPVGPGGDLVHGGLGTGWLSVHCNIISITAHSYTLLLLPVNHKVSPEVAHNSGDLPVVIIKVEDSSGEEVEELVTVSDPPGYGRLGGGEEEVPE